MDCNCARRGMLITYVALWMGKNSADTAFNRVYVNLQTPHIPALESSHNGIPILVQSDSIYQCSPLTRQLSIWEALIPFSYRFLEIEDLLEQKQKGIILGGSETKSHHCLQDANGRRVVRNGETHDPCSRNTWTTLKWRPHTGQKQG